MITIHDIQPGFIFATPNYTYVVASIQKKDNNMVFIRDLNSDTPNYSFAWIELELAVDILNTNSDFKVYKKPKLTYIEEL